MTAYGLGVEKTWGKTWNYVITQSWLEAMMYKTADQDLSPKAAHIYGHFMAAYGVGVEKTWGKTWNYVIMQSQFAAIMYKIGYQDLSPKAAYIYGHVMATQMV